MTTIAYCNGELAADSLSSERGQPLGYSTKIGSIAFPEETVFFAAAGDTALCQRFRRWAADGMSGSAPSMDQSSCRATGYTFHPLHGTVKIYEHDLPPYELRMHVGPRGVYWTTGSGGEFAMGALLMGADAEQAVKIACMMDFHSAEPVTVVTVP